MAPTFPQASGSTREHTWVHACDAWVACTCVCACGHLYLHVCLHTCVADHLCMRTQMPMCLTDKTPVVSLWSLEAHVRAVHTF